MGFRDRLAHGWNAFVKRADVQEQVYNSSPGYSYRPNRLIPTAIGDKSILSAIQTRIAIDCAAIMLQHVRLDKEGRFEDVIDSGLNECLTLNPNLDQGATQFRQDIVMSMLELGIIAVVPIDTTGSDPMMSDSWDIKTLRTGKIVKWSPSEVRVDVYNERAGKHEELNMPKKITAIVENPLYTVMNEPNGTFQRLLRKLSLLDSIDEQIGSGKLDMIIQLPYTIRGETRQKQAESRRSDLEEQLSGSKYGVAYLDQTEKITQLNRPVENNMLTQVTTLTDMLYSQLGLSPEVFNGTASEEQMLNYYNRTIEPILTAVAEAMKRTFISRTARAQGQSIEFFRDPFKLMPITAIAELADKLIRNEVFTGNEFRSVLGRKPVKDPKADMLVNPNLKVSDTGVMLPDGTMAPPAPTAAPAVDQSGDLFNQTMDDLSAEVDRLLAEVGGGDSG